MRPVALSALLLSSIALAACGGGGAGCTPGIDTTLGVGGLGASCTPAAAPTTPPVQVSPNDQNLPPVSTVNTGNTTALTTGDTTLVLESGILVNAKATPALSKLTVVNGTTAATKTAKIEITLDASRNASWPIPKSQAWSRFGTQNEISHDPATNGQVLAATLDPAAADPNLAGAQQMGGIYNEYRALSTVASQVYDEELQVWTWGNSYAAQYRDATGGGAPASHQAWSFGAANGGSKTNLADMPAGGSVTFSGSFTSTAKSEGYVPPDRGPLQTLAINNNWSVVGDADLTVNFGATTTMTGKLDPKFWRAFQSLNSATGFASVDVDLAQTGAGATLESQRNFVNYYSYMDDKIELSGTLATPTVPTAGNAIMGSAKFFEGTATDTDGASDFLTNATANPLYASLFGTGANMELTGVFALDGVTVDPYGGNTAINDDRRAFISHSGMFHAE
jgi:hypothetical protein